MLTRIVKMNFQSHKIEDFEALFAKYGDKIRSANGCISVELLQDIHSPNIFFTYSRWHGEEFLNEYRHSELFAEVWAQTKALFADKPEAWSLS